MKAATKSSPAAPASRRDVLAGLLHQVITSPNQGAVSLAQACATVSLSFAWLEGAADRPINLVVGTPCVLGDTCVHQGDA